MSTTEPPSSSLQGAFAQAFMMIIVSEIGDKTFLIAAILAMRHARARVFAGAFGALVVMSILSAALGRLLPALIPKRWTQAAAAVLFFIFAGKMVREGAAMAAGSAHMEEEMKEAQQEIDGANDADAIPLATAEAGEAFTASRPQSPTRPPGAAKRLLEGTRNLSALVFGPVFVQAFVLTFLGEWGDRSQIATIALAAAHVRPLRPSLWQDSLTLSLCRTSTSSRSARSLATRAAPRLRLSRGAMSHRKYPRSTVRAFFFSFARLCCLGVAGVPPQYNVGGAQHLASTIATQRPP
jgi:putative Ca2+/H+ antiporter (TMEM165/GDT1 family)